MPTELPKAYNPKETEDRIYKLWEESGFFTPENLPGERKEKFVTAIAPPNITGELHLGHALELTLQDILVRAARMQGKKTLWVPGIDHAGIAAQNVVEKQLKKEGISRFDLGREKFEQRVQEWKEKYGNAILDQFKKLGISVDWTRTRYTRDEKYEQAVKEAFRRYHEKGWIYKGTRVINWCPRCGTAISDLEVNYVPEKTKLYTFKYAKDFPIAITTTRPETKVGDTAVAVRPDDKRYAQYVGKEYAVDFIDIKLNLKIIAEEAIDPEFGTGALGVTPAHSIIDWEIAQRHNLPSIKVIDERGKMTEHAGPYAGMKATEAREKIVQDLEDLGLIEKVEDYEHNIARCDRCDSVIEPLPSEQWFLKVDELAKLAWEAVENGEVVFHSPRWKQVVLQWLTNMRDWNISRQLWWGHKIPVDNEEDVLDTWFSSALWPFAVMGWPDEQSKDYQEYYPTQFITSDRGIIFLWQLRMIFSGKFFTGRAPFKDIFIHPTVLTKDGKRMSKSLGTGINPLELIEKYGTDALRFGLTYQVTDLQDMRFGEDTIIMGKKFANKLWNIARYVLLKLGEGYEFKNQLTNHDIMRRSKEVGEQVTKNIENYQFGEAAHALYDFMWHDFADKYIEETKNKDSQEAKDTLLYILSNSLKLLHPFMPFVTEEIYSHLPIPDKNLLLVEAWPGSETSTLD
ncbi:MAG: class I tRNA ligase family protein [Candidatus Yanofskybacteria bacterium]|nr:class I tRNA ligase family protein [Candidatus Yanofskybacteria bacterium]